MDRDQPTERAPSRDAGEKNRAGSSGGQEVPAALKRPVVPELARMLAGKPWEEEILDPANPNLIMDRER